VVLEAMANCDMVESRYNRLLNLEGALWHGAFAFSGQSQTTQGPRRAPKIEHREKIRTSELRTRTDARSNDKLMLSRERVRGKG